MANFISKALLSLVMDKSARETMERRQKVLKDLKESKKVVGAPKSPIKPRAKPQHQQPEKLPSPVLSAQGKVLKGVTQAEEKDALMLVEKIARAEEAIQERSKKKKMLTGKRGELIVNALRIQKAKADVFRELDNEQYEKLQGLAQQMMLGLTPKDR